MQLLERPEVSTRATRKGVNSRPPQASGGADALYLPRTVLQVLVRLLRQRQRRPLSVAGARRVCMWTCPCHLPTRAAFPFGRVSYGSLACSLVCRRSRSGCHLPAPWSTRWIRCATMTCYEESHTPEKTSSALGKHSTATCGHRAWAPSTGAENCCCCCVVLGWLRAIGKKKWKKRIMQIMGQRDVAVENPAKGRLLTSNSYMSAVFLEAETLSSPVSL